MHNPDILLINPPFHMRAGSGNFVPLGLGYIMSAVRNADLTVEVLNCAEKCTSLFADDLVEFKSYLISELPKYEPMLIGIGPCMTSHIRALQIISEVCKSVFPSTIIVCGGPLATMQNQEWVFFERLNIPYIIKGDGERAIPSLIKTIKAGLSPVSCPEISYEGHIVLNEIDNIDEIAFPYRGNSDYIKISDRRKNTIENRLILPMITSRGCVYSCDYCVSGSMSSHFRKRSIENIIEEMISLRDNFGATDIVFYDDCFFNNPKTASKDVANFCNLLLEKNVDMTWQIELRTDLLLALSDDSVKLLEKAGCRQINIGIEKTCNEALSTLGKTSSVVGLKEKNKHITELSSIQITATFILGGNGEDEDSVKQLIADSRGLSLSQAHFNPLFVYPSTRLYAKCKYQDREWYDIIQNDTLPWGEIVYESEKLPCDKLISLLELAYVAFYGHSSGSYTNPYLNRFNIGR